MREIKFRGWERELQMMVYDTELGGWIFEYDGNPVRAVNQMINEEDYFYDLMQYTGLKDKNGTEIYEGDIIWDAHAEIHGKVTFDEGTFCVEWKTHIEHLFEVVSDYYAEVIGNIYENPELLGNNQ